ncbi:hypothetical protein S40285_04265 [Stachybotrys chlorohalonatus IBT 40285]|uniref:Rhodopsin domain-containing protein n=1 Tax=Stachybotrys chlorohalonatus (strain IBT 40285) TaxID=1283841 RepID=A0A084QUC6_STAC4|nr:hypothetical protein S40285_04265 [Stachybotrys chlorohalonata IBT 40285]
MSNQPVDLEETNSAALLATVYVILPLSWLSVGLRVFTRTFLIKSFKWDDWFMLAGQIVFTAFCVFLILGVRSGIGRHNAAITDVETEVQALMWQALATATYVLDMMLIKLSIGLFLLRLAVAPVYKWIIRISLAIITIWSLVLFFWNLFQCSPVEKQWDYRITEGRCVTVDQIVAAAYAISVMTILSDWLYALLPIPMLWNVKMTAQTKATVIAILGLGIFASIATLVRLAFLADLEDTDDILFAGTDAMVWTIIEPGVALIAASLATIRPLLRAMRVPGFDTTKATTENSVRSGTKRSRNKSQPASTPGSAPTDVSLVNLETRHDTQPRRPLEEDERGLRPGNSFDQRTNDSKSEIYVIEGHASSAERRSLDQIHNVSAQSQDDAFIGLAIADPKNQKHDCLRGNPP